MVPSIPQNGPLEGHVITIIIYGCADGDRLKVLPEDTSLKIYFIVVVKFAPLSEPLQRRNTTRPWL